MSCIYAIAHGMESYNAEIRKIQTPMDGESDIILVLYWREKFEEGGGAFIMGWVSSGGRDGEKRGKLERLVGLREKERGAE